MRANQDLIEFILWVDKDRDSDILSAKIGFKGDLILFESKAGYRISRYEKETTGYNQKTSRRFFRHIEAVRYYDSLD